MDIKNILIICVLFAQNLLLADSYRPITENDYKGDGPVAVFLQITKYWEAGNYDEIKNHVTEANAEFTTKPFFAKAEAERSIKQGYTSLSARTDLAIADNGLNSIMVEFKGRPLTFEKINGKWLWVSSKEFNYKRWNDWCFNKIKEENKIQEQKRLVEMEKQKAESDRKTAYDQKEGLGWEDVKVSDIKPKSQIEAVFNFVKAMRGGSKDFSQICTKGFLSNPPPVFKDIDLNREVPFWINKKHIIEKYNNSDKLGRMCFYAFKSGSDKKICIWAEFLKKDGRWILCTQSDQSNLWRSERR